MRTRAAKGTVRIEEVRVRKGEKGVEKEGAEGAAVGTGKVVGVVAEVQVGYGRAVQAGNGVGVEDRDEEGYGRWRMKCERRWRWRQRSCSRSWSCS